MSEREDPELSPAEETILRDLRKRLTARKLKPPPPPEMEKLAKAVLNGRGVRLTHEEAGNVLKFMHRTWRRRLWADSDTDRAEAEAEFREMVEGLEGAQDAEGET